MCITPAYLVITTVCVTPLQYRSQSYLNTIMFTLASAMYVLVCCGVDGVNCYGMIIVSPKNRLSELFRLVFVPTQIASLTFPVLVAGVMRAGTSGGAP